MRGALPSHYFRRRKTGARVFRVETGGADGRLTLTPIAVINLRKGTWTPRGRAPLGADDEAAIASWMEARQDPASNSISGDAIDAVARVADWAQSDATAEEIDAVSAELLLAIHDLRAVLARRIADRANDQPSSE